MRGKDLLRYKSASFQSSPFGNLNFHTCSTTCQLWSFLPVYEVNQQCLRGRQGDVLVAFHTDAPLPSPSEPLMCLVHGGDGTAVLQCHCLKKKKKKFCGAGAMTVCRGCWVFCVRWSTCVEQGAGGAKFSSRWWYRAAFLASPLSGWSSASGCLGSVQMEGAAVSYSSISL